MNRLRVFTVSDTHWTDEYEILRWVLNIHGWINIKVCKCIYVFCSRFCRYTRQSLNNHLVIKIVLIHWIESFPFSKSFVIYKTLKLVHMLMLLTFQKKRHFFSKHFDLHSCWANNDLSMKFVGWNKNSIDFRSLGHLKKWHDLFLCE